MKKFEGKRPYFGRKRSVFIDPLVTSANLPDSVAIVGPAVAAIQGTSGSGVKRKT